MERRFRNLMDWGEPVIVGIALLAVIWFNVITLGVVLGVRLWAFWRDGGSANDR